MVPSTRLFLSLAAVTITASQLLGVSAWPTFLTTLPHSSQFGGGTGHLNPAGSGPRNPFGLAYDAAGRAWTKALCQQDSDGDGHTNGEELGDPCCNYKAGDAEWAGKRANVSTISNPGKAESVPVGGPYACEVEGGDSSTDASTTGGTSRRMVGFGGAVLAVIAVWVWW